MGLFDGKVVAVTGSGGGIGRAHALAFAREGAAVVVNDLGTTRDGSGAATGRMADAVVEEIKKAGGRAAANYDSVADFEGARRLVKTALDNFGRIDILVNNAGILRDKSMLKMEEAMFDIVLAVHLKGSWNCAKHAAEAMVAAGKGGRIVNTTSIAGLKGNFGQSNYGPAKAGIWSLTLTAAIELKKHGITVNAIAPMAKTRMTEDIDVVPEDMKPEHISPVVLWLASDMAQEVTGRCFGIHPPRIFEYKMEMTDGAEKPGGVWTPEEIQAALPKIERLGPPPAAAAAAPVARDPAAIADRLVKAAPGFFQKERAAGMKSNFHLVIKGARDYSILIENGECRVAEGAVGTATCTIKTDVDTYVGMAEGKVNPQKAFMEQKLTADNLPEAMKYATVFRAPKPDEVKKLMGEAGGGAAPQAAPQAAADPAAIVDRLVKAVPTFFVKERAGGMKSNFHLLISGAKPYSIQIENGACQVLEGHVGQPTCKIKTDAATYIGMAEGKVNPQKAFMEQKLTADVLPEAMKYATVFRTPKPDEIKRILGEAQAAGGAAPAAAPAAPASPEQATAEIFRRMGEAFVPAKAAGWKAAILWRVTGAGDYTVEVADGKVSTKEGVPAGKPTCTVKLAAETLIGMVTGKVNPQKAFMEGKISADNLNDMMRFGSAFDMKKAAAAAEAAAPKAAAPAPEVPARPAPSPGEGLNRDYVGKSFSGGAHFARPDMMKDYALATNDPNPAYLGEKGQQVAPPIFAVRLFKEAMFKPITDPGLNADLLRLVHGEQDMHFHKPLRAWDLVTTRALIHSIEDKASGQILRILQKGYVEGVLAVEAMTVLFIRGKSRGGAGGGEKKEDPVAPRGEPIFRVPMKVDMDQTKRYAAASGDDNPIHLDPEVAKMAGLPGIIVHGLCTMAFTSRAIVQEACAGDPTRLKRLAVRFSKPVLPGDTITTSAWKQGPAEAGILRYGFEATNQAGVAVITNGIAEVAL
jgi:NAD(P)-dependent dehydrogenase (short-subunit alcohol dehydrogenase family)/acyl dehydratase/putative sterol carrier protein